MRCGIVGMGLAPSRPIGEITPTIAHVPTGIVHPLPPAEDGFEKLPSKSADKWRISPGELGFVFNSYDDCVASIDGQLGRLFDELRRRKALDRTWVILVSDHGESFGEHAGVFLHGSSLKQTELHVPLVAIPPRG